MFQKSTLDIVLASGGSKNPENRHIVFPKVHPGHCACLRRFKHPEMKHAFFKSPPWTLGLPPAVQKSRKKAYISHKCTLDVVLASGGSNKSNMLPPWAGTETTYPILDILDVKQSVYLPICLVTSPKREGDDTRVLDPAE